MLIGLSHRSTKEEELVNFLVLTRTHWLLFHTTYTTTPTTTTTTTINTTTSTTTATTTTTTTYQPIWLIIVKFYFLVY